MTKKGAKNNDASSIKVFGTRCEAIVYEHAGYKGWKATFKTGVYPFNALNAKGAKNDIVSSIVVQKVADEKMEMNTPPIPKAYENAIHGSFDEIVSEPRGRRLGCEVQSKVASIRSQPQTLTKHGPTMQRMRRRCEDSRAHK